MPGQPLTPDKPLNPRQELFAQAMARGMTQRAAYAEAGYKDHRCVYLLMRKPNVQARIAQLMAGTAARNAVSSDGITQRLLGIADRNETAPSVAGQALARHALMDAAKVSGLLDAKPAPAARRLMPPEWLTEIRRVIVYPDGYTTDYNGNPVDPDRPPYDPSFRYRPGDIDP